MKLLSFYEFLDEARRNPDKNIKLDPFTEIKQIIDRNKINKTLAFVTMHNTNKIGFYTGISHGTPIAVYTYPISFVYDYESTSEFPYKQNATYISMIVLKSDTKTLNLSNLSKTELAMYTKKLNAIASNTYQLSNDTINSLFTSESSHSRIFIKSHKDTNGYKLYNAINLIAEKLAKSPIERSKILRNIFVSMGVDAVKDEGFGIISVEPAQTMIVNLRCIEKVYTILNKNPNTTRHAKLNVRKFDESITNKLLQFVLNKKYDNTISNKVSELIKHTGVAVKYKNLLNCLFKALHETHVQYKVDVKRGNVVINLDMNKSRNILLTNDRIFLIENEKPIYSKTYAQYKSNQLVVINDIFELIPLNEYIVDIEGFNYDDDE